MAFMAAVALWLFHGVGLWFNWGDFRPRLALVHGLGLAVLGGALLGFNPPAWIVFGFGAVIGGVAGWGHRLAPGLWVGIALLWPLPFLLTTVAAFNNLGTLALTAIGAAALASLTKSAF